MTEEKKPPVGALVRDTVRDRLGRVVDHQWGRVFMRGLRGRYEWDAWPDQLEVVPEEDAEESR